jgi:tRNA (uracil-5-)-methyltransferase TRM9
VVEAPDQRAVWERIADSFDCSRRRTWPHVEEYLKGLPAKSQVLDLMCGNGRHTKLAQKFGHDVVSFDWSKPLVQVSHERYGSGVVGDATALPFSNGAFDACIYVAGWHGISTPAGRDESLRELHRVLRPGSTAQITNWSREAPRFASVGVPGESVDVMIPWRSDGHDEDRTYHLTTGSGFTEQCETAGFEVFDAFNVSVVAQPPAIDNHVVLVRR